MRTQRVAIVVSLLVGVAGAAWSDDTGSTASSTSSRARATTYRWDLDA